MRIILLILVCLLPQPPPRAPSKAPAADTVDILLDRMRQRLELMHDVARSKWAEKRPIDDPAREAALLDDVSARGGALGLDREEVRTFFRAQIEAAKLLQRADLRRWQEKGGPDGPVPDLTRELRPRIDALNRQLLESLVAFTKLRVSAQELSRLADVRLVGPGIDAEVRAKAPQGLPRLSRARSRSE